MVYHDCWWSHRTRYTPPSKHPYPHLQNDIFNFILPHNTSPVGSSPHLLCGFCSCHFPRRCRTKGAHEWIPAKAWGKPNYSLTWEHRALFDLNGNMLPAMKAFEE